MEKFELTFPQKNIWLVENFYESKLINIISGSLIIKKDFEISKAEQTVNKFVEINEGMRLRICVENSIPKQYVSSFAPFEADKINAEDKNEQEIDKIKEEYISTGFDVIEKPLFSYLLIDRGNGVGEIFLKAHHLICDGWSGSKMVMGLAKIYDGILEGKTAFEPYPTYLDYIAKEKDYTASEKFAADETFWNEYLKDFNETISIKNTYLDDSKAKRYSVKLNERLNKIILDYCKENKFSPFTIFMTALAIYLERTTEKQDIVIGTPILNRGNFAEKQMQGMFVSTMPVRFKIDEQMTFKELCSSNAKETMSLFRHQRFPISKTIDNLKKNNGLEQAPYKVMVSYQNARATFDKQDTYRMSWNFSGHIQDELEIHIVDLNDDGILEIDYDYITSLFEDKEIDYIAKRIESIIKDGIVNDSTIENIEIMSEEEKKLISDFNKTDLDYPKQKRIIDIFEEQVQNNPSNTAVIFEDRTYSYADINEIANKLASSLKSEIKKGDIVAIKLERSEKVLIAILATLKLGAAYIPLDVNYPKERIEYMLKDANASKVITEQDFANIQAENSGNFKVDTDENEPFYLLYTSGSTGNPKGAMISQKNMMNFYSHFNTIDEFNGINTVISITTVSFDIFVYEAVIPLLFGKTVVMTNEEQQKNPLQVRALIQKHNVDMIQSTPSRMRLILESIGGMESISSIKKVVLAGEQLPLDLKQQIANHKVQVCNGYGPTETTIFSSYTDITNESIITIGKPLSNTKFLVRDSKNRLLPLGITGELFISGDGVTLGYINNDELTKKSYLTIDGNTEYKSGDYVKIGFDLNTICEGRKDSQVKIHGLRIELDEINLKLRKIQGIKDAATIVYEDNSVKKIIAFVVSSEEKLTENKIKEKLVKTLPSYMVPQSIIITDALDYTANAKVDKTKLIDKYIKTSLNLRSDNTEKLSQMETQIIDVIKGTCERDVSVEESFFKAGLDSFDIIRLSVALSNKYNKDILVKDIMTADNVRMLSNTILSKQENESNDVVQATINMTKLSKNQASIFYNYIKDTNSTLYNTPCEIDVGRNIDITLLKQTLISIFNYHEAFKSNVKVADGETYLAYNPDKVLNVEVVETDEKGFATIKNNFVKPFDLLNDTLVRTKIINTEKTCYILFDSHHIVFDGSSIEIIAREINDIFNKKLDLKGTDGYLTYLAKAISNDNTQDINFYKEKIYNVMPTSIESDFKLDKINNHHGNRIKVTLDNDLANSINNYAATNTLTVNSICLSALQVLLAKYTYSENIMIGLATTNRDVTSSNIVGMFVNTLPFISNINGGDTTYQFTNKTNNLVKEVLAHNNCTAEEIIQYSNEDIKDLFSIVYAYQNFHGNEIILGTNKSSINYMYNEIAKFDITFEVTPKKDSIDVVVEYNNNKYSYSKMDKMLEHYTSCIKEIISKDYINQIDILSEKEKQIVTSINKKEEFTSDSIQQIFNNIITLNESKVAVVHNKESITYKELDTYSNVLASMLIDSGITKGDVVPVIMDKSIEVIVGILAVIKAGAAYLPIDINIPNERLEYMIKNVNAKAILTKKGVPSTNILRLTKNNIYVNLEELRLQQDKNINVNGSIKDNCYVMYTSGSTGLPKGVIIRQEGVIRLVKDSNYINVNSDDIVALSGTISFDASVFEMWLAIINGLTLHIVDKELLLQQESFENYIKQNNVTIMLLTTALFNSFAAYKPEMFSNVRYLLTGGDVFSYKSGNNILKVNKEIHLINAYGPTESTVIATTYDYIKELIGDVPIGTPIRYTTCYVVDIFDKLAPQGAIGELLIGGIGVTSGYINNPVETDAHLVYTNLEKGKLYKTGDLVKLNKDNKLVFKRRKDNQIKLNGYRIEISEVLNVLLEIAGIKEAEILFNKQKNNDMVAYIVKDKETTKQDIIDILKTKLPYYMVPKAIVELESMPLTVQGKVDRRKLQTINYTEISKKVKPKTGQEKVLVEIWQKILNRDDIGVQDNFFELGGDSISATQFVMESSNKSLGYVYSDIYNYPTIKELIEKSEEKISKQYDMTTFDYDKLNNNIKLYSTRRSENVTNVLITGTTGFLGAHVLSNYIDNYEGTAYCIIRKREQASKERLRNTLRYFFGDKYDNYIDSRIKVITGDLTLDKFGLDNEEYFALAQNIDAVINCAAYVKHFGNLDKFKKINVDTVSNLINLCINEDKELYHVSTLSVCGNILEGGQVAQNIDYEKIFEESDLYFGQNLNNAYVYSKYLAEVNIIDKLSDGLKATIIRVGNLTGRYSDGKFQPNVEENAFANRIKAFTYMNCIPESLLGFNVEFTPIDYTADAICRMIFKARNKMLIVHVYNNNYVNMTSVIHALSKNNIKVDILKEQNFSNKLKEYIMSNDSNVEGIVIDLNENSKITYDSKISVSANKTNEYLKTLGYEWPIISDKYLLRYFTHLIDIGFLINGEEI